jgi:hypothetical protein
LKNLGEFKMGYQEKKECGVNVVATLTNVGKRVLLQDPAKFEIKSFIPYDTQIDYRLWNPKHPDGFDSYGKAITAMPALEPIANAQAHLNGTPLLKNQDSDVTNMPVMTIDPIALQSGITLTTLGDFEDFNVIMENLPAGTNVQLRLTNSNSNAAELFVRKGPSPRKLSGIDGKVEGNLKTTMVQAHVMTDGFFANSSDTFQLKAIFNDQTDMLAQNVNLTGEVTIMELVNFTTITIPYTVNYNADNIQIG